MPNVTRSIPTTESTSPRMRRPVIIPSNMRDTLQRQINSTIDANLDALTNFGVGDMDGRYGVPFQLVNMRDRGGRQYHIVGVNTSSDWSIAAP
jgi:hypothetical protein